MAQLGIKDKLFFHPTKLNNLLDINLMIYYHQMI